MFRSSLSIALFILGAVMGCSITAAWAQSPPPGEQMCVTLTADQKAALVAMPTRPVPSRPGVPITPPPAMTPQAKLQEIVNARFAGAVMQVQRQRALVVACSKESDAGNRKALGCPK